MAKIINKTDHVIALMVDGKWETIMPYGLSCKLKGMVGYKATWDEMIEIATNQTKGQYELFTTNNN